jgi:hypothetical protein
MGVAIVAVIIRFGSPCMPKRIITATIATPICLLIVGLIWALVQARSATQIGIKFIGLTNNSAGLLGTSDKLLAAFSVTNGADSPIEDAGFYYIEMPGSWRTYSPLGSGGQIPPYGQGRLVPAAHAPRQLSPL